VATSVAEGAGKVKRTLPADAKTHCTGRTSPGGAPALPQSSRAPPGSRETGVDPQGPSRRSPEGMRHTIPAARLGLKSPHQAKSGEESAERLHPGRAVRERVRLQADPCLGLLEADCDDRHTPLFGRREAICDREKTRLEGLESQGVTEGLAAPGKLQEVSTHRLTPASGCFGKVGNETGIPWIELGTG
jgi:hypothetical protein